MNDTFRIPADVEFSDLANTASVRDAATRLVSVLRTTQGVAEAPLRVGDVAMEIAMTIKALRTYPDTKVAIGGRGWFMVQGLGSFEGWFVVVTAAQIGELKTSMEMTSAKQAGQ